MKVAILTTDSREHYKDYGATTPYFGTAIEGLLQGFRVVPEVEVHVVSCLRQQVRSPEKLADNIWYHGLVVPPIGWLRTLYQGCIRATRRKLREIAPDIVHGQGTERDCALAAVMSGFPNVITIHGIMRVHARMNRARPFSFYWLAERLESFSVRRTRGVVCISSYTQREIGALARKTWIVPNAADTRYFDAQRQTDSPPTILCVGLICPRKNQNAFIRSLDPLAARLDFKLVFLGGATRGAAYDDEFLRLIQSRPWCVHAGFAGRDELKRRLEHAKLLALPSLEDNCPMVVLEAMAAGVPVLASNVGGIPDLIADGRTGVLCDPLDEDSMRHGVERLLTETTFASGLADEARKEALKRFHPSVIAHGHLEIYRDALGREAAR